MSLRQATCLTPRRLDAARRNSRRSTGPRTQAGKERMKMNALKHGAEALPEHDAAVMRALGEDPEKFQALKRELMTTYGPGDALWNQQIDDLARLYWRRNRIERIGSGLMRKALDKLEEERRALARALQEVSFEPCQCQEAMGDLPQPAHPLVRRRLLISFWGMIREQVRRRVFKSQQWEQIDKYYEGEVGWRPRQISELLAHLIQQAKIQAYLGEAEPEEEEAAEAQGLELERLAEEQRAAEEAAFEEERAAQEEKEALEREACLAPAGETWEMLLKQEAALDRSIDRKVRILLTLRKEYERQCRGGAGTAPKHKHARPGRDGTRTGTPWRAPTEAGADTPFSVCDSGADGEERPSLRETQTPTGRGLRRPASSGTEEVAPTFRSADKEEAVETPKSPEQSENVLENKGTEAEEVRA